MNYKKAVEILRSFRTTGVFLDGELIPALHMAEAALQDKWNLMQSSEAGTALKSASIEPSGVAPTTEQRDEIKPCQNKGCGFFNEHENDGFKCSRLFEFELRACHDYRS